MSNFTKKQNGSVIQLIGNPAPKLGLGFDTMDDREGGVFLFGSGLDGFENFGKLSSIFEGLTIS